MRPTAQIGETTLSIERDLAILEVLQQVEFIFIPFCSENTQPLPAWACISGCRRYSAWPVQTFFLQASQIIIGYLLIAQVDIIIKPFIDCRGQPKILPGNIDCTASAIRCAEECQKVVFPSVSSQVSNLTVASCWIGLERSQTSPFTEAASTFPGQPLADGFGNVHRRNPFAYSLIPPSGNVILIMIIPLFCN